MKSYVKVIVASFLVILACLGLGRFAFGMVLPNMQESLLLNTTQVGFIGTANFIGYLIGIFFANIFYTKYNTHKLIFNTMILQALSMASMVFISNYLFLSLLYGFSGFFCAIVNISIMAHISNIVPKNIRGKVLGIVVSGSGIAIVLSGQIVPFIESITLETPWKTSWLIFSILIVLLAFLCQPGIKKHTKHEMPEIKFSSNKYFFIPSFWKIGVLYMIFGLSYSVFVTYFVKAVIEKYNVSTSLSGDFWTTLGLASIFSGLLFGIVADKIGAYKTLIFVYFLQTIAHFTLTLDLNTYAIWVSTIVFGISIWSIPSLIVLLTSVHFDVKRTSQILSLVTIIFALCQAIGPVAAGYIYDKTNSFSTIFMITSSFTLLATILSIIFSKQPIKKIH
ncbi:YbfB/YjiJ family MFS transporter [Halarcobacter sp.]|uniref:YbfB/YjiJ family MFS transporter n=1 Tax=Halarcobacter sp. TaxID=2321133 RepID=UPI002AAAF369|nr:YbfB/YjiJ family MFS transporter [Halarcobacter sp.]